MLSLKKLLSNHFIFLRKVVISSMTIFLLLFGVMPVKVNKVYADENVKINPFIWLMSYFGVNIYTDAVQINEAFDTAIRLAYNTYLASLQPQQQVSIDDIIGSIEWTPSQPNVLRITGTVFNALKGFANWINSRSINDDPVVLEQFETVDTSTYIQVPIGQNYFVSDIFTNQKIYISISTGNDIRLVYIEWYSSNNTMYRDVVAVSLNTFTFNVNRGNVGNYINATRVNTSNNGYIYYTYDMSTETFRNTAIDFYDARGLFTSRDINYRNLVYSLAFGTLSEGGETILNDIFALPEQDVLDDLIGAADPDQDVEIDLTGSDLPYTTAATLEDILSAINNLVDSYVQDNSYAETIGKIIAQGIAIDDELVDITYPEALTWEVPDLISIPAVYPIIYPDCPDLSACLISGVQEVSNTMNGIINAHPDTGNYVTAALYMGLVLLILGSTVL